MNRRLLFLWSFWLSPANKRSDRMKRLQCKIAILVVVFGGGVLFTLPCCSNVSEEDTDWPMFMHDLFNTGYSPSAAPDSLYLLWEFDIGERLFGSPVVSHGTVYQVGRGSLFALDLETGEIQWSSNLPVVGSTPFVTGEYLYVGTCNGIAALNSRTGELLWQVKLANLNCNLQDDNFPVFLASSPILIDKSVIMCTHHNVDMILPSLSESDPEGINRVVCLDSETGTLLWEYSLNHRAGYSPAFRDGEIIVNSLDLKVLDSKTGEELWSYLDLWLCDTSPVVSGQRIITVREDDGVVFTIDSITHELLWEHSLNSYVFSTPAVHNSRIIVVTRSGAIFALDETTGNVLWKKEIQEKPDFSAYDELRNASANFLSSPAIADNKVFVGLWSGTFFCLRLDTGEILWQYKTEGPIVASPAVAGEKVVVASTDGKVYCFGIDPETYFEKAEEYRKQKNTERAREFYVRAREYYEIQDNREMVTKCEKRLEDKDHIWIEIPVIICIILGALLIYWKRRRNA